MGIFRRGNKNTDAPMTQRQEDYSDVEGIIVNVGVIEALVASFVVAMQMSILPRTLGEADFMGLMCSNAKFRKFAVKTMESYEHGDFGMFNFTHEIVEGEVFDIKQWLLVEWPQHKLSDQNWGLDFPARVQACNSVPAMASSVELMMPAFPMERMHSWIAWHREEARLVSAAVHQLSSLGGSFIFGSLFISVLLYISLTLSPAHEDTSGKALKAWTKVGMPIAILNIFLLAGSMTCFCLAMSWTVVVSSSDWDKFFGMYFTYGFRALVAPLTALGGLGGIVAFGMARCNKERPDADAQAAAEEAAITEGRTQEAGV